MVGYLFLSLYFQNKLLQSNFMLFSRSNLEKKFIPEEPFSIGWDTVEERKAKRKNMFVTKTEILGAVVAVPSRRLTFSWRQQGMAGATCSKTQCLPSGSWEAQDNKWSFSPETVLFLGNCLSCHTPMSSPSVGAGESLLLEVWVPELSRYLPVSVTLLKGAAILFSRVTWQVILE